MPFMPISDDWDFDYPNKVLRHVDGILSYGTGSGTQPSVGQYIIGATSGAIAKVIATTGTATTGTLTLTNVEGLFESGESISVLSEQDFDAVTSGNGGFAVGDTIVDQVTGSIDVLAIEYNFDGAGGGTMFGDSFAAFTNDSQLDISGGQSDVADADGTGTDNSALFSATTTTALTVPGTASTNDCVIIHYDAGTVAIPEQAILEDSNSDGVGLVEQVNGTVTTGSVRLVDYDSTGGGIADDDTLRVTQVVNYDNQVGGQVFSVGNVIVGSVSGATGRVIAVIDDGDSTGRLILADQSGTFDAATPDLLQVDSVTIAECENTTFTLNVATANLPNGVRTQQRPTAVGGGVAQGGIFPSTVSLNIVRKNNSLYTYSQDTFDELLQMDDDEAMDAAFKGFAYSLVFDWRLEGNTSVGSDRFLRQGALIDTDGAEVWANARTQGAQNKITATAFLIGTGQTFRQPQLYIEQDGAKVTPWWLEGNIDILLKVRTKTDPRYVDPGTPALGQLIPGGDPAFGGGYTVFNREYYTSTYDATEVDGSAGVVNNVALGTADDSAANRNPNGTHTMNWDAGSAATLLVGEEFFTAAGNTQKVGIVVAQTGGAGATGTLEYVLKSGTQFANNESLTAIVSGKTFDVDGTPTAVVAGYSADIRFSVVDLIATPSGGTGITGDFIPGEGVTQASTGATGFFVAYDNSGTNTIAIEDNNATAFSGDNDITGDVSGASWDAGTGATYPSATTFDEDLNNGEGDQPYAGSVSADIAGTGPETMQNIYQYAKYITRQEEESLFIEGPGTSDDGTVGNLYRRLKDDYAEVKPGAPIGTYTGTLAFAQGWFLDTAYVDSNDIRSFTARDDNGVLRSPPNLQALTISGVDTGWRVAAYRSTGAGLQTILRTEFDVDAVGGSRNAAADSIIRLTDGDRTTGPTPADVPNTGVLRILDPNDTGSYLRFPYSSVDRTNDDYTLASGTIGDVTSGSDLTAGDDAHVVFIEETVSGTSVSNTMQYVSDIPIFFVARLKGFKPFRSTTTFGSSGGTGGVVQTPDGIVDLP